MNKLNTIKAEVLDNPDWTFLEEDNLALTNRHFHPPKTGKWKDYFLQYNSSDNNKDRKILAIKFFRLFSELIFSIADYQSYPEKLSSSFLSLSFKNNTCKYYISILQEISVTGNNELFARIKLFLDKEIKNQNEGEQIIYKNDIKENINYLEFAGEIDSLFLNKNIGAYRMDRNKEEYDFFGFTTPLYDLEYFNNLKDSVNQFEILKDTSRRVRFKTRKCIESLIGTATGAIKFTEPCQDNVNVVINNMRQYLFIYSSQKKDAYSIFNFLLCLMRVNNNVSRGKSKKELGKILNLIVEDDNGLSIKSPVGVELFEIARFSENLISFNIHKSDGGMFRLDFCATIIK